MYSSPQDGVPFAAETRSPALEEKRPENAEAFHRGKRGERLRYVRTVQARSREKGNGGPGRMESWIGGNLMLKKAAFLALALVLAIGLGAVLSFPAAAEEPTFEVDGYQLAFDKASGTIMECADASMGSPDLTIPAELDGVAVTGIGERAFSECESLENLTLPESVTWIGDEAFQGCASLRSVLMPGMVSIGPYAFASCGKMESISLPASLEQVGEGAFSDYPLTTVIYFDGTPQQYHSFVSLPSYATVHYGDSEITLSWDKYTSTLVISGTGYMDDSGYDGFPWGVTGRGNIMHVTVEPGVKSIGTRAFSRCSSLRDIVLPEGIEYISEESFYWCSDLREIFLPEGLECITEGSFSGCSSLKTVSIPGSVTSIHSSAFNGCSKLELVMFSGSKEQWDAIDKRYHYELQNATIQYGSGEWSWAFDEDSGTLTISGAGDMPDYGVNLAALPWYEIRDQIRCVVVEDGIRGIGSRAFSGCGGLETVEMSESVQTIGMSAFSDCVSMSACVFSPELCMIGEKAFYQCAALSELHLPEGITEIPSYAFSGCVELTEVTVPDRVTKIGQSAFEGCSRLISVTLPEGLAIIQRWTAFDDCAAGLTLRGYDRTPGQALARDKGFQWESLGTVPVTTVYILPESETRSRDTVKTELLEAMQNHTRIVLADGSYFVLGGLWIDDLCDLSIEAEHPGRAELLANEGTPVVLVRGSCFVDCSGLSMGHYTYNTTGFGCGPGSIVYAGWESSGLTVVNCDLWGCGTSAVDLNSSRRVDVSDSILRDCEYEAVYSYDSEAVRP